MSARDTRRLLGTARAQGPDCPGSGADFEAVNAHLSYGDVTCSCGRRFTVRVIRTRRRAVLPFPTLTVPRHRATP